VSLAGIIVLTHALIGFLFMAGLVGRWIVLGMAQRAVQRELATISDCLV
jgi:hypothetical protein